MPNPVNTKTFTGSIVVPPDGYVLTYDTADGYYKPKPLPNPGQIMSLSSPAASPYNVDIEDVVPIPNHTGTFIVNLPTSPQIGRTIFIKDGYGGAGLNPINIAAVPLIDGYAIYPINTNFGAIRVIFTGTTYLVLSKAT
jgi:hypothetical protein